MAYEAAGAAEGTVGDIELGVADGALLVGDLELPVGRHLGTLEYLDNLHDFHHLVDLGLKENFGKTLGVLVRSGDGRLVRNLCLERHWCHIGNRCHIRLVRDSVDPNPRVVVGEVAIFAQALEGFALARGRKS